MTTIILGVFVNYFNKMQKQTNSISYPFSGITVTEEQENNATVMGWVFLESTMDAADHINFLLDKVLLPLNDCSITCQELRTLFTRGFETKTTFWLKGKEVATERVIEIYNSIKENKLSFDDIKF
jgi:hypothetical protein